MSHPRFLEFVAPGVSKGRAVAWLAHRAGIPMGQVMAIGDSLNDVEMIGDAGHGAAMPTAPCARCGGVPGTSRRRWTRRVRPS